MYVTSLEIIYERVSLKRFAKTCAGIKSASLPPKEGNAVLFGIKASARIALCEKIRINAPA